MTISLSNMVEFVLKNAELYQKIQIINFSFIYSPTCLLLKKPKTDIWILQYALKIPLNSTDWLVFPIIHCYVILLCLWITNLSRKFVHLVANHPVYSRILLKIWSSRRTFSLFFNESLKLLLLQVIGFWYDKINICTNRIH